MSSGRAQNKIKNTNSNSLLMRDISLIYLVTEKRKEHIEIDK